MKRVFTIGEKVWYEDDHESGWATIILLNGSDTLKQDICHDDCGDILTLRKRSGGEIETTPSRVWQKARGRRYKGYPVVWEHNTDIDFPFFCPDLREHCYHVELD